MVVCNEMKVTNKRSVGFYTRAARSLLKGIDAREASAQSKGDEAKAPVDVLTISGLGEAINVAITVAMQLQASGMAAIASNRTDYPDMAEGRSCTQITITLYRLEAGQAVDAAVLSGAPKIELHVHLDGAFDNAILFQAAQECLDELPEEVRTPWDGKDLKVRQAIKDCHGSLDKFEALVSMKDDVRGLFPMLDCFYIFLPIVRGRFSLVEELAYAFCRNQARQNILYTEVRYSPHEFLPQDSSGCVIPGSGTAATAVETVSRGLDRGQKEFGIVVKQILCCIAAQPSWSNETVSLAAQFRGHGVVGVDLAAGEMHFDDDALGESHRAALCQPCVSDLGVTIHAAEAGPAENVTTAMDRYGAVRIGHGYRCCGTDAQRKANEKNVHFELCPTSSVGTMAVDIKGDWSSHPVVRFCKQRTSCSIASDDPSVFRSTLTSEYLACVQLMGLTLSDMMWMTLQGIKNIFNLAEDEKSKLESRVTDYYARYGVS